MDVLVSSPTARFTILREQAEKDGSWLTRNFKYVSPLEAAQRRLCRTNRTQRGLGTASSTIRRGMLGASLFTPAAGALQMQQTKTQHRAPSKQWRQVPTIMGSTSSS